MSSKNRHRNRPIHDGHQAHVQQTNRVTGTYQIPGGRRLHIAALPPMLVWSVQAAGKPQPPVVEMEGLGGKILTTDANDPAYQDRLADWEEARDYRVARLLYLMGVTDDPPAQEAAVIRAILSEYDPLEVKFHWVASLFKTDADLSGLMEAVLSLSVPTEDGIQDAEAIFPGAVPERPGPVAPAERVESAAQP
jgi:hypothetical protein